MTSTDDAEVRRLALSCLLLGWDGPVPPPWLAGALRSGLAGVVLFASNVGDGDDRVAALTERTREDAQRDVVVAIDEEGGVVTRLDARRGSESPGAAALGYLDDPAATETVYRHLGARCASAGITVDLAPVADVNLDPLNPVIGVRSFSDDPVVAARHVAAATRGIQANGVAACLKHFPGHGATRQDSHREPARLDRDSAAIRAVELEPFRAGIAAGARAVMTGHLHVPALDPGPIATVSSRITRDLLRGELGFGGTVVTDALEMAALADTTGVVEGFVAALVAGADCVETGALERPDLLEAIPAAVVRAVAEGRLPRERLADAAGRTARLAGRAADRDDAGVPGTLAASCLEIVGELPRLDRPLVVECRTPGGMASGRLPWSLGDPLAELVPGTETVRTGETIPIDPGARSLVLVVSEPGRRPWQLPMIDAARRLSGAVVVDVGWPTALTGVPLVRTRGISPSVLHAAARLLAGAS